MMVQIDTKLKTRQVGMPEEMSGEGDRLYSLSSGSCSLCPHEPKNKGISFSPKGGWAGNEYSEILLQNWGNSTEKFLTLSLLVPQSRTLKKGREATKLPFFCSERNEVI